MLRCVSGMWVERAHLVGTRRTEIVAGELERFVRSRLHGQDVILLQQVDIRIDLRYVSLHRLRARRQLLEMRVCLDGITVSPTMACVLESSNRM